jgi:hypothetical protein
MHHRKYMSRDHHPPLRDVTVDTEKTASSIAACWTVFTELLPGNALIKSVTLCIWSRTCEHRLVSFSVSCLFCEYS